MGESAWSVLVTAHDSVASRSDGNEPVHAPTAAVLACSDARVPPSVVFGQPAGSLFVVRIAGNTASPSALASLDYAIGELGVDLVVVLGHTGCGAVHAAVSGQCDGHLYPIVAPICALAHDHPGDSVDEIVARNVQATIAEIGAHPGPLGRSVRSGAVAVRGAVHDLRTGKLRVVDTDPPESIQPPLLKENP